MAELNSLDNFVARHTISHLSNGEQQSEPTALADTAALMSEVIEYLQELPNVAQRDDCIEQVNLRLANTWPPDWSAYLLRLRRHWNLFGDEGVVAQARNRLLPQGQRFFDQHRAGVVRINSINEFERLFAKFSHGALRGLSFANIVVAGGSVLSCLTEGELNNTAFSTSDIDIFIYALDPQGATEKLIDIEATLRMNIASFDECYTVERSISTVSFIPLQKEYRKIQVILRLYATPGEVLANFDLDQVAVAFDGVDVLIEPRAARAILTGFTYATHKSFSNTTACRILKYAERGYGMIFRTGVGDASGTPTRLLAEDMHTWATSAYDKVAALVASQRCDLLSQSMEHHIINMQRVATQARDCLTGPWLEHYRRFTVLSALYAHACENAWLLQQLGVHVMNKVFFPYGPPERLFYDENDNLHAEVGTTASLWEETIAMIVGGQNSPEEDDLPPEVWKRCGDSVEDVLRKPLHFFLFLPKGIQAKVRSSCPSLAEHIELHVRGELFVDMDGVAFDLCSWSQTSIGMWQPATKTDSNAHDLLRFSAIMTNWTMHRVEYGARWQQLRFGRLMARYLVGHGNAQTSAEDDERLCAWITG
ncbi:hypothetical protein OC842_001269 [Tilletia horrida]|uniref:Uncharacterized protein n=1 Tax=Tilletia horrida TaxID=155126 RepID=A0AAN6JNP7_9BASI|nr:hypothetical protein OC842_001269 [Tilletia horrida]